MKTRLFEALAFILLVVVAQAAAARTGPLVQVAWLQEQVAKGDVLVLDASSTKSYMAKHIPGATSVDLYMYGPTSKVAPAEMEARIQSWGVSPGRKIVIYDEGASNTATWLFFELYYYGVPEGDLSILDGGLTKWEAAGGAVTKERSAPPSKGTFRLAVTRENVRVRMNDFMSGSADPAHHVLVEALEPSYHFGEMKFFDRAGHIPTAVSMPGADFYNADKTFKSPEEIQRMAAYLGVKPEQEVLSYCGGGVAATVPFFALKFLSGYPDVKVYKESLLEWLQDERDLPTWTYDAPHLKRESAWLNSWNNKMMRMYGVTKFNVIDVRAPEQFKQNHVPYALNIPVDVFRANLDDPAKLAQILGPAGVDPTQEAVIVSDGALNEQSALAFLMLEKLGQKKVSVLMSSVDDWGMQGLPLTKEQTAVGVRKPMDVFIPAVAYPAHPLPAVMTHDLRNQASPYPKVFIASGKKVPDKAPDGKVVHLAYTELLNSDGTPKAAAQIWNALTKAGVPRYAELITYSENPGEAAINYFILRLMGFPDVKVLLP